VPAILRTTDGGAKWWAQAPPKKLAGNQYELAAVNCATSTDCLAVGVTFSVPPEAVVLSTGDGGRTWTALALPDVDLATHLLGVTCVTASDCWAVGFQAGTSNLNSPGVVLVTADGGTTWSEQPLPIGVAYLNNVACANTADCWAVGAASPGAAIYATTDGGQTWQAQEAPAAGFLYAIACPSSTVCFAGGWDAAITGPVMIATTDGGQVWTEQSIPPGIDVINNITCVSVSQCWAAGAIGNSGLVLATTDGGSNWTTSEVSGSATLRGISCPSRSFCAAVGSNATFTSATAAVSTDGGSTWTAQSLPSGINSLYDISCPSSTHCYASGASVSTHDGGSVWSTSELNAGPLYGIACTSRSRCSAAGSDVVATTHTDGDTWQYQQLPPELDDIVAIACPASTNCWAVGYVSSYAVILASAVPAT
jgi:photosystem II stability/assembly factor-like uncharacterized protein